jgi:hypothetical protein
LVVIKGELTMTSGRQEFVNGKILAPAPEVDFALVLSRVIASAEEDPSQLRNLIYELARTKLQEEMSRRSPSSNSRGTRDLSLALESAIERVEVNSVRFTLEVDELLRGTQQNETAAPRPGDIEGQQVDGANLALTMHLRGLEQTVPLRTF